MAKKKQATPETPVPEMRLISELRPHPRNYKGHPTSQLDHIAASLQEFGMYKNVVLAEDGTILAGHGVVAAAKRVGMKEVLAVRLPIGPDSPAALKLIAGDNEVARLGMTDDRGLAELLRDVFEDQRTLLGTGFSDEDLRTLETVLGRPKGENDPFEEWAGMPECESEDQTAFRSVKVNFASEEDLAAFAKLIDQNIRETTKSIWFPKAEIGRFSDKAYDDAEAEDATPQ